MRSFFWKLPELNTPKTLKETAIAKLKKLTSLYIRFPHSYAYSPP